VAVTGYFDAVQKIYIAFYQRPADPAGLRYWGERLEAAEGNATAIINAFANAAEAQHLYGPINEGTIGDVIDSIYQALFGRTPDAEGKAYYEAAFADGTLTAGNIALAILNASKNDDQTVIANKLVVANKFTEKVDGRGFDNPEFGKGDDFAYDYTEEGKAAAARKALANVNADSKSMLDDAGVKDVLDDQAPAPTPVPGGGGSVPLNRTYTLTTDDDSFAGRHGNDKFIAKLAVPPVDAGAHGISAMGLAPMWQQTLNDGDNLNGGGGKDVLIAEIMEDVAPASLQSIETIVLSGQGALDLTNADAVERVEIQGTDLGMLGAGYAQVMDASPPDMQLDIGMADLSLTNLRTALDSLTITDALGRVAIHHDMSSWDRPADELALNLRNAIGLVEISGSVTSDVDQTILEADAVYSRLAIDSGSAEGKTAYGNYVMLAGAVPAEITVKGEANFGFIAGAFDSDGGKVPASVNAEDFTGNLAAILVGEGDTSVTGGEGDDLLGFIQIPQPVTLTVNDAPSFDVVVDGGAGDDCIVFSTEASVTATGGAGNDHFVFLQLPESTGFGERHSVDGDSDSAPNGDTDTLWLDLHSGRGRTLDLFGDTPLDNNPQEVRNIQGIERVVHFALLEDVEDHIHADMARVPEAVLELAADYNGHDVTVTSIVGAEDETDVIVSGNGIRTLTLENQVVPMGLTVQEGLIGLAIRTVSSQSIENVLEELLGDVVTDGNVLNALSKIHSAETYAQVLESLKDTSSEVVIDRLKLGEGTGALNLSLDESGSVVIKNVSGVHADVTISGGADLAFGGNSLRSAYQGDAIDASTATGNLEVYLGLGAKTVTAGQGDDIIHVHQSELAVIDLLKTEGSDIVVDGGSDIVVFQGSANNANESVAAFKGRIDGFDVKNDKIGIQADARDISPEYANGTQVTGLSKVNILEVERGDPHYATEGTVAGGTVSISTNFLKFVTFDAEVDASYSFSDVFAQAIGGGHVSGVEVGANLLAVMYDKTHEQAILFEVNSGLDDRIDVNDAGTIEVVTTIGMSADDYINLDAGNIQWFGTID
jgi:hypothetical protein